MSLAILADVLKSPLVGRDAVFTGIGHDTRTLQAGDLYVAIKGEHFDGHHFLAEAIAAGAAGALLARDMETPLPYVRVPNTRLALGNVAAFWRNQFRDIPVIAVTGSNGKTTVKEMIGAIMGETGPGCVTRGNLNNDIGVPLTLARLRAEHRYAVIEMGMNHPGEIEYLSRLTHPTIAVITNAGEAHLAGVGTVEDVARAKGEIFIGLARDGTAVLNADDAHFALWRTLTGLKRSITFGLDNPADVSAEYRLTDVGSAIHLKTITHGEIDMRVPLLGRHNVMNTLAATTAAIAAGATLAQVKTGLEKLMAVSGRLEVKPGISGARVIDDTYNANPASLAAGIQVLKEFSGERVLVMGDMAELGAAAADIHYRVGELANRVGIQRLFAIGELARVAVAGFGKGARHFESPEALIEALQDCMHADMTVLVKGSRVMRMERIVAGITKSTVAENGRTR
ncbi:MAG TPA: UDP-N-acetylmuramoyl-tripeptide--D-alanyl-D-alanine ligase [Candidatus Methylomirabilis sp.]|nr:UDP-N-acetylmuramoyl-tripeptide--D-alanyl-D-alanine ligase [Candidatus Methylomirabilis sp.]